MAELVANMGDTFLLRMLVIGGHHRCGRDECPRLEPGSTYVYWYSEDQGSLPTGARLGYCSQECFMADQTGPKPTDRRRGYGERMVPGEYTWDGRKIGR